MSDNEYCPCCFEPIYDGCLCLSAFVDISRSIVSPITELDMLMRSIPVLQKSFIIEMNRITKKMDLIKKKESRLRELVSNVDIRDSV